jgi:hypothetical protein
VSIPQSCRLAHSPNKSEVIVWPKSAFDHPVEAAGTLAEGARARGKLKFTLSQPYKITNFNKHPQLQDGQKRFFVPPFYRNAGVVDVFVNLKEGQKSL